MLKTEPTTTESLRMRRAGKEALSLALIESRNRCLRWFGVFEAARDAAITGTRQPQLDAAARGWARALAMLGHAGWFQEYWIARNTQRTRGTACDSDAPRLASIEPNADRWWRHAHAPTMAAAAALPDAIDTKRYLADTIEVTLELLAGADDTDDALYFYRLALFTEDLLGETYTELAQAMSAASSMPLDVPMPLLPSSPRATPRTALHVEACRWMLGSIPGGFVFDSEKWAHPVDVAAFEIDAQPVDWAQFAAFVEDGGYDERCWWSSEGWAWLRLQAPDQLPRYAEQVRHGVVLRRFGHRVQVPLTDSASHLSLHEADAWCRWAGRRLPTESEWEVAAYRGSATGFRWGTVWEWTASAHRHYPGFVAGPAADRHVDGLGALQVLRGASLATSGRLRHPKFRAFRSPDCNVGATGFRSCAPRLE